MISIPAVLTVIALAATWQLSGKVYDLVVKKLLNDSNTHGPTIMDLSGNYCAITSPFSDHHFIEFNGVLHPKYRSVYQHSEYIHFNLDSIELNSLVTHYVIKGSFKSTLEHNYDITWEEGIIDYRWTTKLQFEDFPNERMDDENFRYLLEYYCLAEIWDHYYKLYPELLQHPSIVGTTQSEHEYLR